METLNRRRLACAAILAACSVAPAFADTVDMAAAKKEGAVTWYTSVPVSTAQKIANLFEQKTGIKVELFRSGGSNILRRFQQEASAGKVFCDVLTHSEPAAARAMTKKGMFVPFKPTDFDKVPAAVNDPDGYHVAQRLNVMAWYVRDEKLPAAQRPRSWTDLTDGRFKGRLVMPDPSFSSLLVTVAGMLSKQYGWKYFEELRKNELMVVESNQQVADMVKRGERPMAIGAEAAYVGAVRKQLSISVLYPQDGTFVIPSPSAIAKGSPHPNAARAFTEFLLSKPVQEISPAEYLYSSRIDLAGPEGNPALKDIKMFPIDYDYIEAQSSPIKKKFAEIVQ